MSIELDLGNLSNAGQVAVNIQISTAVSVSAPEAKRRATRLVASELGNLLQGGDPTLFVGTVICWRVPVLVSNSAHGFIGQAGFVDIDANTGAAVVSNEQLAALREYAIYLAERATANPT